MIAIAWVECDGILVDDKRVEWRNGLLSHAVTTGIPVPRAVNFSTRVNPKMLARAEAFALDVNHPATVVLQCKTLEQAKAAALAKWHQST